MQISEPSIMFSDGEAQGSVLYIKCQETIKKKHPTGIKILFIYNFKGLKLLFSIIDNISSY
jgi:hypothetical protein